MVERTAKLANTQCPPLPRDSTDRGGAVGGGVRIESTSPLYKLFDFLPHREAATRLTVNSFGSVEPLPLSSRRSDTGEGIRR